MRKHQLPTFSSGDGNAAFYGRVSTEDQADNFSEHGQLNAAREFCAERGLTLAAEYFDSAKSGKSTEKRAALQRMLEDARRGRFTHLVVWKLTRLTRNLIDTLTIIDELDTLGVQFHSISESDYDTSTPSGRVFLRMMATMAEFEREVIVDNIFMGMMQRAREGGWNGRAPFGYRSVEKALEVVPGEAAVVNRIFESAAGGRGLWAIANRLNNDGVRTKTGSPFSPFAVSAILHNPVYVGMVRFNCQSGDRKRRKSADEVILVPGTHAAIVERDLWERVQAIRAARAGRPKRVCERGFPLTGLLRCPQCGAGMVMSRTTLRRADGEKYALHYYACGRARSMGKSVCGWNSVRAEEIERAVFARLSRLVTHPTLLRESVDRINRQQQADVKPLKRRLEEIARERARAEALGQKYRRDYAVDRIGADILREGMAGVTAAVEQLIAEEGKVRDRLMDVGGDPVPYAAVRAILESFVVQLGKADADRQRALLQMLVEEITFVHGKGVSAIRLRLSGDAASVLGMVKAPSLGSPVMLMA